jgi:hypothetical protein
MPRRAHSALEASFAGDFVDLTDERMLGIVASALGWPVVMPLTVDLDALGLTEPDLLSKEDADDAERLRRLRERSQIKVDGRDRPVGKEHMAAMTEAANATVNEDFLSQDGRALAIPALVPATLAASAVVGERQQATLEPVLTTPISREEFMLGKALAVVVTWSSRSSPSASRSSRPRPSRRRSCAALSCWPSWSSPRSSPAGRSGSA